ncbi:MAG: Gfo/Idh/MocA family oxidoreductase [Acidobacteriota bacterium]
MNRRLRTAVIGVGYLGREHARIYATLQTSDLVAVCDLDETAGRAVAERYGTRYVSDFHQLFGDVDAVTIATPTINHAEIANACMDAGISVLVEKPIARSLGEADAMIETARARGVTLQVGHIERFNPAFRALQEHIQKPRFFEVHRMGVFTPRSLDIDVVMDLMVHELDIIATLVATEVTRLEAVGVPILTRRIDLANARLEFADGCIANITASRVAGERLRKLRVFQLNEYYSLDYAEQQVSMCRLVRRGEGRPEIVAGMLEIEKREPLLAEIDHFLECVLNGKEPLVSGRDGRRALELASNVLVKIREHADRAGLSLDFG